jgi:prophage maintenance system killer protein
MIGLFVYCDRIMNYTKRQLSIFWLIFKHQPVAVSELSQYMQESISIPSLNRDLAVLKANGVIKITGKGPSTKYIVPLEHLINITLPVDEYYLTEPDDRVIIPKFNISLFETLTKIDLFEEEEIKKLNALTEIYRKNTKQLSKNEFKKEFERLTIELSWKSSQIEGNTYDLLDTEQLLKYNILSNRNSEEEAIMLLNHKAAIEYSHLYAKHYKKITTGNIIELHTLLTKEMGIAKNIRKRLVRITGTNYTPPENIFLIEEYLERTVKLVNTKKSIFEKALLSLLLISYIQPFEDGNKRTARLTANAILMAYDLCPLSYRSIKPTDYKKAMLLFYEVNNITAFKKILMEQYEFAVKTYF